MKLAKDVVIWRQIALGRYWSVYGIESNRKMGGKPQGTLWPCQKYCTVLCVFIRKLFGKMTVLPYITSIYNLFCINASPSPSLLSPASSARLPAAVQLLCTISQAWFACSRGLYHSMQCFACSVVTHALNLPFYWHRWEKEKPVSWTLKALQYCHPQDTKNESIIWWISDFL